MKRIVAFTKDWSDVPTCTTHVLREMAKALPVLWIESIGTRKPSLAAGKDLRRIGRRLKGALAGAVSKENGLRVLSPFLIPKTESAWGRWLNRRLVGWQIRRGLRRMPPPSAGLSADGPVEYWCFVPNAVDLLPTEREVGGGRWEGGGENVEHRTSNIERRTNDGLRTPDSGLRTPDSGLRLRTSSRPIIIYYCVDDWSQFHNLDGEWLAKKEEQMLRRADVVFTPARYLEARCRRIAGDRVHHVPHGVDFAMFARALDPSTTIPADIAPIPKPVVGFYGNLHSWVDFGLIGRLARLRPHWSFVLIGEIFCDVSLLRALSNIHFLGRREHATLPAYCRAFNAAIIPYDMKQARMESVNPVKTKELLAAGVPVVAADVPELRGYGDDVMICRTDEEWVAALEKQLARTDRREISARVSGEDWSSKVSELRAVIRKKAECHAEAQST
jgi:glycosyltransferase involved in cell wall biosynthesis